MMKFMHEFQRISGKNPPKTDLKTPYSQSKLTEEFFKLNQSKILREKTFQTKMKHSAHTSML